MPLTILPRPKNGGLGAAISTGIAYVRQERLGGVLVTMDADNTQDPAIIPAMLAEIERGADLVVASRFAAGGSATSQAVLASPKRSSRRSSAGTSTPSRYTRFDGS